MHPDLKYNYVSIFIIKHHCACTRGVNLIETVHCLLRRSRNRIFVRFLPLSSPILAEWLT